MTYEIKQPLVKVKSAVIKYNDAKDLAQATRQGQWISNLELLVDSQSSYIEKHVANVNFGGDLIHHEYWFSPHGTRLAGRRHIVFDPIIDNNVHGLIGMLAMHKYDLSFDQVMIIKKFVHEAAQFIQYRILHQYSALLERFNISNEQAIAAREFFIVERIMIE